MEAKHRFLISEISNQGYAFVKGREVKHARKVLRLSIGDLVVVFDEEGNEFLAKIKRYFSKEDMEVTLVEKLERKVEADKKIHLVMGLCRSKNFELALQKCTEIGISSIIPLETTRSILKGSDAVKKIPRWRNIALDAVKQSKRTNIPEISTPYTLESIFRERDINPRNSVVALISENNVYLRNVIDTIREEKEIYLFIGPEGGFADGEIAMFVSQNIPSISLGKRVLRAETAAIYLTSILFYELG